MPYYVRYLSSTINVYNLELVRNNSVANVKKDSNNSVHLSKSKIVWYQSLDYAKLYATIVCLL